MGDVVRVRVPFHVSKEKSKFSEPQKISVVQGNCVTLADGRKWNASKLVHCNLPAEKEQMPDDEIVDEAGGLGEQPFGHVHGPEPRERRADQPRTSGRVRAAPAWMRDYVTN